MELAIIVIVVLVLAMAFSGDGRRVTEPEHVVVVQAQRRSGGCGLMAMFLLGLLAAGVLLPMLARR